MAVVMAFNNIGCDLLSHEKLVFVNTYVASICPLAILEATNVDSRFSYGYTASVWLVLGIYLPKVRLFVR
jgi:hypothetical protein